MLKEIKIEDLNDNIVKLLAKDWMLVSAGEPNSFNTMTASWGAVGYLWNKPVAYIFIRPERYTYEFTESNNFFTLSFFSNDYRPALTILGSKSGRDMDKISESGLTTTFTPNGNPTFTEARIVMECKKLYATMLNKDSFIDTTQLDRWYSSKEGELHKMYIAEITNIYISE